jgi:peptidoglycan/xylan/chitin deacetylase (PgdA/CDA1 family)
VRNPRQNARKAAILLYHRVAPAGGRDPLILNVSPARFAEQVGAVLRRFQIVPLADIAVDGRDGAKPRIAITFDDGYTGVLDHAKPVLERAGAVATAFVPTGFVRSQREFWWEELEDVLLSDRPLPPSLDLDVAGRPFRWSASARGPRFRGPRWKGRARIYYPLVRLLARVGTREREECLARVFSWAGAEPPRRRERMPLSERELRALGAGGVFEVGAHTVSHPVLASLDAREQAREIVGSKEALEAMTGQPVTSFAYPHGSKADYTSETVDAVRAAGFARACTSLGGPVQPGSDPLQLPRVVVRDWPGEELLRRLDDVFAGRSASGWRVWRRAA